MSDNFNNIFPEDTKNTRDEEHSFLKKLDERTYARGRESFIDIRTKLPKKEFKAFSWQQVYRDKSKDINYKVNPEPIKKSFSLFSLGFLIFSIIIFLGAAGYAFFSLSVGGYAIKQDKIDMALDLPSFTNSGADMQGQIVLANTNRVEFIESFISLDIVNEQDATNQNITQIDIGKVDSGQSISKNININLNGKEGENKTVQATLFYKITGSDTLFEKKINKQIKITKSPLIVNVIGSKSISIGQISEYKVSIRAGTGSVPAVAVKLDLPRDFKIVESSITPESKNYFNIGNINEGQEKVLTFKASYKEGLELIDNFSIKVIVGTSGDGDVKDILSENNLNLNLVSIPFKINIASEDQNTPSIYFSGKTPKVKVTVSNISKATIKNGILNIKLYGGLFNPKTVSVNGAQYDASLGTIKATAETNKALKEILPDEKVEFEIAFTDLKQTNQTDTRRLTLETSFSADIPDSVNSPATARSLTVLLPKDNTNLNLKTLYFSGAYKNTGAMPPRIGQKTTYTVVASVDTLGGFDKGIFSITLPEYVDFIESSDPSAIYKKDKRQVIWNIGSIQKSKGEVLTTNKKEVSFRVSIIPSPDQFRLSPALTRDSKFEAIGIDKNTISIEVPNVSINFSNDPKYESAKGYAEVAQ